jgi:hypothetical protein
MEVIRTEQSSFSLGLAAKAFEKHLSGWGHRAVHESSENRENVSLTS